MDIWATSLREKDIPLLQMNDIVSTVSAWSSHRRIRLWIRPIAKSELEVFMIGVEVVVNMAAKRHWRIEGSLRGMTLHTKYFMSTSIYFLKSFSSMWKLSQGGSRTFSWMVGCRPWKVRVSDTAKRQTSRASHSRYWRYCPGSSWFEYLPSCRMKIEKRTGMFLPVFDIPKMFSYLMTSYSIYLCV